MSIQLTVVGLSDIGRVRRRNEDSLTLDPVRGIAVVADGMGGHPGGDVASATASDTASAELSKAVDGLGEDPSTFREVMRAATRSAVLTAHRAILRRGAEEPTLAGMGTTLTCIVADPRTREWVVGHVGDSRAYHFRDGALAQLTRDDTWVQQQIERGELDEGAARRSPYAHLLTQCLGLEQTPTPELLDGTAEPGDVVVLCTDGLVGMIDDEIVRTLLARSVGAGDVGGAATALLRAANEAGGHDNVTVAIVHFG